MTNHTLAIETRSIDAVYEDPDNARRRGNDAVGALAASLKEFGQQKPIVVAPDGKIIAGNGTYAAARSLGWSEISVVVTHLDEARARAFAIADNRTGELSEWDEEALLAAIEEADSVEILGATGFLERDLARLQRAAFDAAAAGEDGELGAMVNENARDRIRDQGAHSTRSLVLPFSAEEYQRVSARLAEIRGEHGLASNSEALLMLVGEDAA